MMKLKGIIIVLLLQLLSILCLAQQSNHLALLVGVANYPENSGWKTIHSNNDVELLKEVLSQTFSIRTLVDNQATYKNITQELARLGSETKSGDTVIILFSCHGQQMKSSNEADSLDEALIPYDAGRTYSDNYKGEKHLRDDELARFVLDIQKKAGNDGFVIVILDACHSGDSFRDADSTPQYFRGVYDVFGPSGTSTTPVPKDLKEYVRIEKRDSVSDVIYMAACKSSQLNEEIKDANSSRWYGALAYSFSEMYQNQGLSNMKSFCEGVSRIIRKKNSQCPEFASTDVSVIPDETPFVCAHCGNETNCCICKDSKPCKAPWGYIIIGTVFIALTCLIVVKTNGRRK